jgi:hypothetical protein
MFHTPALGEHFAANGLSFYCDISEFQPYYNSSYPYNGISFRVFNGNRVDNKAAGNWAAIQTDIATGKIKFVFPYVVFMPGKLNATMAGLKQVFGSNPPPAIRIAPMNDMESGAGFAGSGNHSAEANQWMVTITAWLNNAKKKLGYANGGDWASNWPTRPSDMLRVTAAYNAKDPGTYAWQYAGGNLTYPIPAGFPRSVAPFGTYVDINVIRKTPDQIAVDFGFVNLPEEDDMPNNLALVYTPADGIWIHYIDTQDYFWLSSMDDVNWYIGIGAANNATKISAKLHADLIAKAAARVAPSTGTPASFTLVPSGTIDIDAKVKTAATGAAKVSKPSAETSYAPYADLEPAS